MGDMAKSNEARDKLLKIKPLHPQDEFIIEKAKERLDTKSDLY
jgi:preprotein translocase subunit Sec63